MENYWHICTDGLAKNVIFKNRADYVFGMNSIPVCTLTHSVTMLAFCLMSITCISWCRALRNCP